MENLCSENGQKLTIFPDLLSLDWYLWWTPFKLTISDLPWAPTFGIVTIFHNNYFPGHHWAKLKITDFSWFSSQSWFPSFQQVLTQERAVFSKNIWLGLNTTVSSITRAGSSITKAKNKKCQIKSLLTDKRRQWRRFFSMNQLLYAALCYAAA